MRYRNKNYIENSTKGLFYTDPTTTNINEGQKTKALDGEVCFTA